MNIKGHARFICTVLLLALLLPALPVRAQGGDLRFSHLTPADGLPHDIVNCLLQDRTGYLWFGTQGGLSRYDGYTFTNFHHHRSDPDSLVNDTVNALYEDRRGSLWVGTVSGLDRYDAAAGRFVHYPAVYESVRAFAEDAAGNLWIGTAGSGIFRYDAVSGAFTQYLHDPADPASLPDDHVNALLFDPGGTLWIGTDYGGLAALDPRTGRFASYSDPPPGAPTLERVTALTLAPDGALWVGAGDYHQPELGGLARFDRARRAFTAFYEPLRNHHVTALLLEGQTLWIGAQDGLYRYDLTYSRLEAFRHDPLDPFSLSDDQVTALLFDRSGNLWIATKGGGVSQYPRPRLRFDLYTARPGDPNSLAAPTVGAVWKDRQGFVWIGLHDHGLDRLDRRTGQVTHFRHDPADPSSLAHDHVTALYEDRRGDLWIGTQVGLDRLDRCTDRFEHFTWEGGGAVKGILEDAGGALWIGTEEPGALLRFDPHAETFIQYRADPSHPNSLSHDFVWALYQDPGRTLWAGTHGGLDRLDWPCGTPLACEPSFTAFTTEGGLPDDSIVAMQGEREQLPAALEPVLFRIVQEALHNVARHAQARRVWVTLDLRAGLLLRVRDDGLGFDPAALPRRAQEGHLGLQQMRERVEALGGALTIRSAPGHGTEVEVRL